jgi:alpha-D-xyloside xylohydrolase
MGKSKPDRYSFGGPVKEGEGLGLDYYIIYGPDFDRIMSGFAALVGPSYLGPKFLYGFYRAKYPTMGVDGTLQWARRMREGGFPGSFVVDPVWNSGKFTVSPNRRAMIAELGKLGFQVATCEYLGWTNKELTEAGIQPRHSSGMADLSHPKAVEGYWDLHKDIFEAGIGAWGLDAFERASGALQNGYPGQLLPMLTAKTLVEKSRAAGRHTPCLSRGGGLGAHRYVWGWPGDLGNALSILAVDLNFVRGMGLSGFNGSANMGGYMGGNDPEAYMRRVVQMALVLPIARMHGDRDPWTRPKEEAVLFRFYFRLRFRLMPYLYSAAIRQHQTGRPALAPLVFEQREDPEAWKLDHHFFFGDRLLAAPVTKEKVSSWPVFLPPGGWYHFWSGARHEGGQTVTIAAPIFGKDGLPLFVKEGSILPLMPEMEYTGQKPADPMTLLVFPKRGRFACEVHDAEVPTGPFRTLSFWGKQEPDGALYLELPPAPFSHEIILPAQAAPGKVRVHGQEIPRVQGRSEYERTPNAWWHGPGLYPGSETVSTVNIRIPRDTEKRQVVQIP